MYSSLYILIYIYIDRYNLSFQTGSDGSAEEAEPSETPRHTYNCPKEFARRHGRAACIRGPLL